MKNLNMIPYDQDEQLKLSIFSPHPDPPWMDFSRSTNIDEFQSLLIMELQKFQRSHTGNSEHDHIVDTLSQTRLSEELLPTTSCIGSNNVEMYWSTAIPYSDQLFHQNLRKSSLYFSFELYTNFHTMPKKLRKPQHDQPKLFFTNTQVFNTQPHFIQRAFAVNTFFYLSLQEQENESHSSPITLPDELASQLISSVSCAIHEIGYDAPCFIQIEKKISRYLGVYYRIPTEHSESSQPFLVQYFSFASKPKYFDIFKEFKEFSVIKLHKTIQNSLDPSPFNQLMTWKYGSAVNPFDFSEWPNNHPVKIFKNKAEFINNFSIDLIQPQQFYKFPQNLLTVTISIDLSSLNNNQTRSLQILCHFKPWISPTSQLFENLVNLRFQKESESQIKVQNVINLFNKRSYEHQLVKQIFKKKENNYDSIFENQASLISNELLYAREGLFGAPFGSTLSIMAFVSSTLPEKAFSRFWEKSLVKIKRRWSREELIPHINSYPDGPNGQVLLSSCLLQQQLSVLNSCTINKAMSKSKQHGYGGQIKRDFNLKNKFAKDENITQLIEPSLSPFPPYSNLTFKLWESTASKQESDYLPLLRLIYEFNAFNPNLDYSAFTQWLHIHFSGAPLFFRDQYHILAKKSDQNTLSKRSHDVKDVWEMLMNSRDPSIYEKICKWEPSQFSNPAMCYVFNSSISTILEQLMMVFIKNIMEMWGYSRMNFPHILINPALQKLLLNFHSATSEIKSTVSDDSKPLKKLSFPEKTSLLRAYKVLERSLIITYILESTFKNNKSSLERILTQYSQSLFDPNDLFLQPLEVKTEFTNKNEIAEICELFGIETNVNSNRLNFDHVGCLQYISSSIDLLIREPAPEPNKTNIVTARLHADAKINEESLIACSIVSKDILKLNMYF